MRVVIDGIPVRVSWKHNKHMYLYISPTEGVACVTAPIGAPMQRIERFVRKKRDWIEKQQKKYRESKLRQEKLQEKMKAAQVDVRTYLREEIAELLPKWEERTDRASLLRLSDPGHEDPLGQLQYADRKAVVFADAGLAAPGVRGVCDPPRAGPSLRAQPQRAL